METRLVIAAVTFTLLSTPAYSQFLETYSQWERLSDVKRGMYLAGVFDSMFDTMLARPNKTVSEIMYVHDLVECSTKPSVSVKRLSEKLQAYVRGHPALARGRVTPALEQYLRELCGLSNVEGK
jgi:hypothetical protein